MTTVHEATVEGEISMTTAMFSRTADYFIDELKQEALEDLVTKLEEAGLFKYEIVKNQETRVVTVKAFIVL